MIKLTSNRYGTSHVRLLKVKRDEVGSQVFEWCVKTIFTGDFEASFELGDNARILPADTVKNSVFSLARNSRAACPEEFAQELIGYILDWNSQIESVEVSIEEQPWDAIDSIPSAFRRRCPEVWTTSAIGSRTTGIRIRSGIRGFKMVKTDHSSFQGFIKDSMTTLPDTSERLLGFEATVRWTYAGRDHMFDSLRSKILDLLSFAFADHESFSEQHTLQIMGRQVLDSIPEVVDLEFEVQSLRFECVDLSRFGQDNPNEVFSVSREPFGYVEAKFTR